MGKSWASSGHSLFFSKWLTEELDRQVFKCSWGKGKGILLQNQRDRLRKIKPKAKPKPCKLNIWKSRWKEWTPLAWFSTQQRLFAAYLGPCPSGSALSFECMWPSFGSIPSTLLLRAQFWFCVMASPISPTVLRGKLPAEKGYSEQGPCREPGSQGAAPWEPGSCGCSVQVTQRLYLRGGHLRFLEMRRHFDVCNFIMSPPKFPAKKREKLFLWVPSFGGE